MLVCMWVIVRGVTDQGIFNCGSSIIIIEEKRIHAKEIIIEQGRRRHVVPSPQILL